ncbi:MAG: homocysteine S-methyltransferase family protein [Rhodospirillales bacterium]
MANDERMRRARQRRLGGEGAPIVIDGGMGTELEKRGVRMDSKAWSGVAVLEQPAVVRQVHEDFIAAGAEVIITNTFSSARHMLEPAGYGKHVEAINREAVALARAAVKRQGGPPVAVAGSICEWTTADGSKWSTPDAVARSITEQATILATAGVDLIALEMCQDPPYTVPAVDAAMSTGLPVWIGVSCRSRPGVAKLPVFDYTDKTFEALVASVSSLSPECINIMHSPVPDVAPAIDLLKTVWSGPIGVYPESGYFKMPNWQFVDVIEPADLARQAERWLSRGVRLFGGCCGLGVEHVRALSEVARAA